MQITQTDTRLISSALRSFSGHMSHVSSALGLAGSDRAYEIAALRYCIWGHRRVLGLSTPLSTYQILLCKMVHMYPEESQRYAMGDVLSTALLGDSRIAKLYNKYCSQMRAGSASYGSWLINAHESVLYSLYFAGTGNGPLVVNTANLQSLLQAYDAQVIAAEAAEATKTSVRSKLLEMQDSTSTDRKAQTAEGKGKCFGCEAVKPRGVPCSVCGYRPRSASMR